MDWLGPLARFAGAVAGPFLSRGRRIAGEREAANRPTAVTDQGDAILDDALRRLGTLNAADPWWKRWIAEGEGKLVRPDEFQKPHVRAWLSTPAVARLLKAQVRARTAGAAPSAPDFDTLVASHMAESLEDRQHAESAVVLAIAFLQASLQGAAKDPGTTAVVQAVSGEQWRRFDTLDQKLTRMALNSTDAALPDGSALLASLAVPQRHWDARVSPPAALLRAEFGAVPFWGRADELERLSLWVLQSAPLGVALVTGPGGRGKTRLAIEATLRAHMYGWRAGFVDETSLRELLPATSLSTDRLLVVIDYAEDEPRHLIEALALATQLPEDAQRQLRIVLLARNAGEWWEHVRSSGAQVADLTHHPERFLRLRLGELAADTAQAAPLLQLARAAFRDRLEAGARPCEDTPTPCSCEALLIFAQALLLELGEASADTAQEAVLGYLLSRERGFWHRALARQGLGEPSWRLFELLVTVVTLAGGLRSRQDVDRLLKAFTGRYAMDVLTAEALRLVLIGVYGVGDHVEPLQPDRLGELLIATHVQPEVLALASFREGV